MEGGAMFHEEGPWIPGHNARFEWPVKDDPDLAAIRSGVQEGGPGLYLLYLPLKIGGTVAKVLAEAYHPNELRPEFWSEIDPRQRADWQEGRLIVVNTVPLTGTTRFGNGPGSVSFFFGLDTRMVDELRKNNRNARSELRRQSSAIDRGIEMRDQQDKVDEQRSSEWLDMYVDAYEQTQRFALGKPRVSMYTGRSDNG